MLNFLRRYYSHKFVQNKFNHLLTILISLLVIGPIIETTNIQFPVIPFIYLCAIIFTLRAIILDKKTFRIFLILALIAFMFSMISDYKMVPPGVDEFFYIIGIGIYLVFLVKSIGILIKKLITMQKISTDTIKGGICVYFLIGLVWALFYSVIYHFDKSAFSFDGHDKVNFLYFSFTVLTTLGFGDIITVNKLAINLTSLEAITGQMFLAIFIARLIGLYIGQELNRE